MPRLDNYIPIFLISSVLEWVTDSLAPNDVKGNEEDLVSPWAEKEAGWEV
jgi:hypothetical protein